MNRSYSDLQNVSFEYAITAMTELVLERGTTDKSLIEEDFFNFRLSLSLNDKWFRRQKILLGQ